MDSSSSKGMIERVGKLLRSVLGLGATQAQRAIEQIKEARATQASERQEADSVSEPVDSASGTSTTDRDTSGSGGPIGGTRRELPDLDASDSDFAYSGEPGDSGRPPNQAGTGGPASEAADAIRASQGAHSDFDDSEGELEDDGDTYLPDSSDPNEAFHLHDAVGRHERADADDDGLDGPIDTSRDEDLAPQRPDELGENSVSDISPQEEVTAFEGAGTDEFTHGGYEPIPVEPEDIESAAAGEPADLPEDISTSDVGEVEQRSDPSGAGSESLEIQHYNYGAGDLGVGRAGGSDVLDGGRSTQEGTDSGEGIGQGSDAPSEGDAFAQVSDGDTAQIDRNAYTDRGAEGSTSESSGSAIGHDAIDARDALGSTLDHIEESSDAFDPDNANLAGEPEMSIVQPDLSDLPAADADSVDVPEQPYADIPSQATEGQAEDDGPEDFSGSQYPSDLLVDRHDGDDPFDAVEPDIGTETSSAGDLDRAEPGEELLLGAAPQVDMPGGVIAEEAAIDQELLSTEDDSIGDAPTPTEMARGTESGVVLTESDDTGDTTTQAFGARTRPTSPSVTNDERAVAEARQRDDMSTGMVRGDGTTNTPEGYPVKGNASSKIYHLPDFPSYAGTKAEFCFATEQDAINAGFRAPGRRNQGRGRS